MTTAINDAAINDAAISNAAISNAVICDTGIDEEPLSDEELTALALAADPDQLPDPDAIPLAFHQRPPAGGLPQWYMPAVVVRGSRRWKLPVVLSVIVGFLLIDGFGLCITYGQLVFA